MSYPYIRQVQPIAISREGGAVAGPRGFGATATAPGSTGAMTSAPMMGASAIKGIAAIAIPTVIGGAVGGAISGGKSGRGRNALGAGLGALAGNAVGWAIAWWMYRS